MRYESNIQSIGGKLTAYFRVPSDLLTAVEKEVIVQQGAMTIDVGGTIVDSEQAPVLSFVLPARQAIFPSCLQVTQEFDAVALGADAASRQAQAWIKNCVTRLNQAYLLKAVINPGPTGFQIGQVLSSGSTLPSASIPLSSF